MKGSSRGAGCLIAVIVGASACSGRSARSTPSPAAMPTTSASAMPSAMPTAGAPGLPDMPPERDIEGWDTELRTARCERDQRCEHRYVDVEACLVAELPSDYDRFFAGVEYVDLLESVYRLANESTLDACLASIENSPCDDARTPYVACSGVLVALEPRAEGEPCRSDSPFVDTSSCGPGLVCSGFPAQCGSRVCVPMPPAGMVGDDCILDQDCAAGLVCIDNSVCIRAAELPTEGQPCDFRCQPGLLCSAGACIAALEGDTCDPAVNPGCLGVNLSCEAESDGGGYFCQRHAEPGDPCPRAIRTGARACERGAWCVFATPDAEQGICGVAPLSVPSPCTLFADDGSYYCPVGSEADIRGEVGSTTFTEPYCQCLPVNEEDVPFCPE